MACRSDSTSRKVNVNADFISLGDTCICRALFKYCEKDLGGKIHNSGYNY